MVDPGFPPAVAAHPTIHARRVAMYVVQSRINGYLVDEERCATLGEAREVLDRRRRLLATAIVVEDPWRHVVARTAEGWITVMIADGEQY